MAGLEKMLQQAQQMQQDVERTQNEFSAREFTHSCQGVEAVVKGDMSVAKITLSPALLENPDKEMLEDVILLAVNGALAEAQREMAEQMGQITSGLNLSGLF